MNGIIPEMKLDEEDKKVLAKINRELKQYSENLEKIKFEIDFLSFLSSKSFSFLDCVMVLKIF